MTFNFTFSLRIFLLLKHFLSYWFSKHIELQQRERRCINSLFQFPAAVTDCRSVCCIAFHSAAAEQKKSDLSSDQCLWQQLERWLMGSRRGRQYLLSCCVLGFSASLPVGWRSHTLTFHQPSDILWHLSDSPPRPSPWEPAQTERGAAGGQTSDQWRNMF